jgi:23S rRNA (pseudouridine1915-N3)-methyltransferase
MKITIISVGTKPKNELRALMDTYSERLPRHIHINWLFSPHGNGDPEQAKTQESSKIIQLIPDNSRVFLLDERGSSVSSESFAATLFEVGSDATFIIGGAYGVTAEVFERAQMIVSLSSFVLPHQLVRLILSEQIYRAHCITTSHPYHHA